MTVEVTEASAPSSPQVIARGEEAILRLPENPTTGYRWEVTPSGTGVLQRLDDRFVIGAGGPIPGAAGQRVLRFVAQGPGQVELCADLRRSWDPPGTAIEKRRYSIVVP